MIHFELSNQLLRSLANVLDIVIKLHKIVINLFFRVFKSTVKTVELFAGTTSSLDVSEAVLGGAYDHVFVIHFVNIKN